ncbi:hypothetical protein BDP27DRAFT_764420 [Rhodocollybia butyracea]|uniref:MYND-type domain-containing protein n=1 Tax=Rhodocollybia butyracea TaxID=206335 RepID=A0A9P5PN00_9AGAR|nr:hypothetical protein BDP27DRAFT_764420 [Rhodocollybia butyracea]
MSVTVEQLIPLPEAYTECEACGEEDEDVTLLRCSRCKNKFYCSERCQRSDWKTHRFDCSELPVAGDALAILSCDSELQTEVARVIQSLKQWRDASDRNAKANKEALKGLQESQDILEWEKQLPTAFQYSHSPALHQKHVFRKPLMLIARLLFSYSIAVLPADEKTALTKYIASTDFPSSFPQLYAPKVVARPAKLSSGEYETLTQILGNVLDALAPSLSEDLRGAWRNLMVGQKRLYNA